MGFSVITVGNIANDWGHHYSDFPIVADYSNPNNIKKAITEHHVRIFVPGANDLSILACRAACFELNVGFGFDEPETRIRLHQKHAFWSDAFSFGQNVPSFYVFPGWKELRRDLIDHGRWIVKPVVSSGGKGVMVINKNSNIDAAFQNSF